MPKLNTHYTTRYKKVSCYFLLYFFMLLFFFSSIFIFIFQGLCTLSQFSDNLINKIQLHVLKIYKVEATIYNNKTHHSYQQFIHIAYHIFFHNWTGCDSNNPQYGVRFNTQNMTFTRLLHNMNIKCAYKIFLFFVHMIF